MNGMKEKKRPAALLALLAVMILTLGSCTGGLRNRAAQDSGDPSGGAGAAESPYITAETSGSAADTAETGSTAESPQTESTAGSTGASSSSGSTSTTAAQTTASKATSATTAAAARPSPQPCPQAGKYIVGYYADWASVSGYTPDKIDASKLTHLNYAFAKIDGNYKIALTEPSADSANFEKFRRLKARYPALKTLISVGGWADSALFSDAASTSANRAVFAQSCLDFILANGFDGVDIDWEYPVAGGMAGNSNRPEDKQNFTFMLQAIRDKLNQQSGRDGKTYYLTVAGGASSSYINRIEVQKVAGLVDYIFIMGYDMHGPWDKYADLNAPLYVPDESSPQYKIGDFDSVNAYLQAGVSPSKLVLGMPFYGHRYTVTDAANNGLYGTFTSYSAISYDEIASGYLNNPLYQLFYHPSARVPYLFGNNTFISFDNAQSIAEKAQFAKSRRLAGVGAWELSQDRNGVLLGSAYTALYK